MDTYLVIARRYRPQAFEEVVGQRHVARTLKNAILEGRIGHAYVFAGPRGVGKTSMARIFAKALNCRTGPTETPCQTCDICKSVTEGSDPDVVEIDAASSRHIEDVQALREKVLYAPLRARFKVYILDEAHQMSKDAFNALLKTLEEPPPHAKFVFATTDPLKLPETILSRCQRFDFRRVPLAEIRQVLRTICGKENVSCPDEVLAEIAAVGDGSMRDAESLLDQALAFTDGSLTTDDVTQLLGTLPRARIAEFFRAVAARDARRSLEAVQAVFDEGRDPEAVCQQAIGYLRDALLVAACGPAAPGLDLPAEALPAVQASAKDFSPETLMYFIQLLSEAQRRTKEGLAPQMVLEVAALKMARWEDLAAVADLAARLDALPARSPEPRRISAPPSGSVPGKLEAKDPSGSPHPVAAAAPADLLSGAERARREPFAPATLLRAGARADATSAPSSLSFVRPPPTRAETPVAPGGAVAEPAASGQEPGAGGSARTTPAQGAEDAVLEPRGAPADGDLARCWPVILERVRAKKGNLAAYLREARPVSLQGSEFSIAFPSIFPMHKAQVEEASHRQIVEAVASAVLGVPVTLHCGLVAGTGDAAADASRPATPRRAARSDTDFSSDPAVKRVVEVFAGRVVNVEKE